VSGIGEVVEQRAVAAVGEEDPDRSVHLVLPADTRLVRLARLLTSGVAASAGFDVEEVEDLRIAVDEVCASLIERGGAAPLQLRFVPGDGSVLIEIARGGTAPTATSAAAGERARLSEQILAVVVDDLQRDVVDGVVQYRLRKWHVAAAPERDDREGAR
jgi:serine/threonine-protein kinase RsbW